jgi:hypothetical protein
MLPRRGIISGKEKTRGWKPLHIIARIQTTIAILMVRLKINVGRYIQR